MSTLERGFQLCSDRYRYDAKLTASKGWAQVDTWQDASYFGVWANPFERKIFTYCEGDTTLETCTDDEDFKAALERCLTFYDKEQPTKIDAACKPELIERFKALGFGERLH